jgi:hypothetical protein
LNEPKTDRGSEKNATFDKTASAQQKSEEMRETEEQTVGGEKQEESKLRL